MRSKSEHKIHHDHRHFWIARFFDQAADTVGRVNHWMRLAVGEVIIAKVEEGVFDAAVDIFQAEFRIGLNVAVDIAMFFHHREHGFVAQRAAAEQAAREAAAEQAARKAEAERQAAELKAKMDAERSTREIAAARKEAQEASTLSSVDRMLSGGFEANRGRLPMPISGSYRVVSHFGQYNVEGLKGVTLDNKGINIQGKPGCVARSIYDGEVSAVFGYGGMWNVLVRHGAYISVYCNLKSVSVHKGQKVSTRQALGSVGSDNILQFQLRKETAKLNPEAWLSR